MFDTIQAGMLSINCGAKKYLPVANTKKVVWLVWTTLQTIKKINTLLR